MGNYVLPEDTYLIQRETLTAMGDAIRAKTGETEWLAPADMTAAIEEFCILPTTISKMTSGVFTPTSSNYISCVIDHNLGEVPDFVVIIHNKKFTSAPSTNSCFMYCCIKKSNFDTGTAYSGVYFYVYKSSSSTSNAVSRGHISSSNLDAYFNDTNFKVGTSLDINAPYIWICGKFMDFAG